MSHYITWSCKIGAVEFMKRKVQILINFIVISEDFPDVFSPRILFSLEISTLDLNLIL